MKEIHAYLNKDGTYRLEMICETENTKIKVPRAKVYIEYLQDLSSDEVMEIISEE